MAGANFHKENKISFNLTSRTISIGRNKQVPAMSPSILVEGHFDTVRRHISTYYLGNMLSGHLTPYPFSPKKERHHINTLLSKRSTNLKGKTKPDTVRLYLSAGVMKEAGQKFHTTRNNPMLKTANPKIKDQPM